MYIAGSIVLAVATVETTKHFEKKKLTFISYLSIAILIVIISYKRCIHTRAGRTINKFTNEHRVCRLVACMVVHTRGKPVCTKNRRLGKLAIRE